MFAEYRTSVLEAYKKKRAANTLSPNLIEPTPGKLRAECITVFSQGYSKNDERTLSHFFGPQPDATAYMQTIRRFDVDKFRPLKNFLTGGTGVPDDKNVELLAWLIGYEPRPYRFGQQQGTAAQPEQPATHTNPIVPATSSLTTVPIQTVPVTNQPATSQPRYIISGAVPAQQPLATTAPVSSFKAPALLKNPGIIASVLIVLIIGAGYAIRKTSRLAHTPQGFLGGINTYNGSQKCMYWTGDHYAPVSCNQQLGDTLIRALDVDKMARLQRITRPDTLTRYALGKVWYAKIYGKVEFYTDSGHHPVHVDRRLRPLTSYMLNKYVFGVGKALAMH